MMLRITLELFIYRHDSRLPPGFHAAPTNISFLFFFPHFLFFFYFGVISAFVLMAPADVVLMEFNVRWRWL